MIENEAYKRVLNCTNITDIQEIPENTYFKLDANEVTNTQNLLEATLEYGRKHEKSVGAKRKDCGGRGMAVVH
jgi:hypothetical protein